MSDLTLPVRITAARRLLSEGMEEFHDLPPQCQAHLQEAIEFLTQVESHLDGGADGPASTDGGVDDAGLDGDAGAHEPSGSGPEGDGGKKW